MRNIGYQRCPGYFIKSDIVNYVNLPQSTVLLSVKMQVGRTKTSLARRQYLWVHPVTKTKSD